MSYAEIIGRVAAGSAFQIAGGQIVTAIDTSTTLGAGSSTNASIPTQLAVQTYVIDSIRAIDWKESVTFASTAALTANYVGTPTFTLTNSGALAALQLDGTTVTATKRVLIKNQATGSQNGIYTVTTVGDGATAWVLTRAADFDSSAEISAGAATYVESGTANGGLHYVMSNASFASIDVQDITWTRMGGASTTSFPIYTLTSESFENPVTAD
jgi:hypothetical protein